MSRGKKLDLNIGASFDDEWGMVEEKHKSSKKELLEPAKHQLGEADRNAGVEFDRTVWLGSEQKRDNLSRPIRIIQIHYYDERVLSGYKRKSRVSSKKTFRTRSPEHTLLIATDRMDLPAEFVGLIYRYRWEIELFFRWFKCILGCQHPAHEFPLQSKPTLL